MKSFFTTFLLTLLFTINIFSQTGKITGYVKDAATGETLLGVNIIVEGTKLGAATNAEGYYVILNIPPGTYNLKATMIGYAPLVTTNVRVSIGQTTESNFALIDQSQQTNEVVIVAEAPIVQKDVSSSTVNLNFEEIKNMPVVNVSTVVNLQAGIQGGAFRGGGSDQTAWMLNGVTLRDERTNQPYTNLSMTSVKEIQVLTGGFNAEFGDIRSGIVNVVSKEGELNKFTVSLIGRYRPTGPKHFGSSPQDRNAFWIRPFVDDNVAWTGTARPIDSTIWDKYTAAQYVSFDGFNTISQQWNTDNDPNTPALSPQALQRLWLYQHRKNLDIDKPDYDADLSVSGYFPGISQYLGNLRFLFSYKAAQEMYIVPLSRDGYRDQNWQARLTSDVGTGMKLSIEGLKGYQTGTTGSSTGTASIYRGSDGIASAISYNSVGSTTQSLENRLFTYDYWAPTRIDRNNIAVKFTHAINANTFYDATISRFESEYETNPGRLRDTTKNFEVVPGYFVDEGPNGFWELPSTGVANFRMSVGFSNARDSSKVRTYTGKFDITSQLDKYNNIKAGFEFRYSENLANYAYIDKYLPSGKYRTVWNNYPIRGSVYVQDKLEFEGMIANLGVRFDYSDPNFNWYVYDTYTSAFSSDKSMGIDTLLSKEPVESKLTISPRLGIAFPITENSKLFFNYGHFRQLPTPENLYLLRRFLDNNLVTYVANPTIDLPKTVAYELGYEQNLLDQFLIRVAGYYKDVSAQPVTISYVSRNGKVNYASPEANQYQDIRGFEVQLTKNRGDWFRGFINYTYMVTTTGRFGFGTYYENPAEQRDYERTTKINYQERPVPRPFARINLDFMSPAEFGPELGSIYPLGDWVINFLGVWNNGYYFTWTGGGSIPGVQNNVQWQDFYEVDVRLAKNFNFGPVNLQLFVDVNNIFNIKYMTDYGFSDTRDYEAYMKSLHLPKDAFNKFPVDGNGTPKTGYLNDKDNSTYVFGNDKPGDYRKGAYIPWDEKASEATKAIWRENKSYIDMPNQQYFTFLNPRDVYFGIRFSWDLSL